MDDLLADFLTETSESLAELDVALVKLERGTQARPLAPEPELLTTSSMMIANPFRGAGMSKLFSTHPPIPDRVRRLEQIAGESLR